MPKQNKMRQEVHKNTTEFIFCWSTTIEHGACPEMMRLNRRRSGMRLELIGTTKDILNNTLIAQDPRPTMNKWDLVELKSFCIVRIFFFTVYFLLHIPLKNVNIPKYMTS